jgi:RsiW-degrading membrane proteinase PrsW (M82 family)
MNFLALLALALAPGVAIAIFIYLKDKHEREPVSLLLICFFYGTLSTVITFAISYPVGVFLLTKESDVVDQFYNAFFKVALIEEFSKFLFVRFILFYNKNFNEPFDGIVYAVMVSMGFATIENILYVFQQGYVTGILRIFTAVPAHATFAVMMGYFLGRAKFIDKNNLLFSLIALASATLFHGLYDYFWFISYLPGLWIGGICSLVLGFMLSRKAIQLHQKASPFIIGEKEEIIIDRENENDQLNA